jgi:cell division septation protein DedD
MHDRPRLDVSEGIPEMVDDSPGATADFLVGLPFDLGATLITMARESQQTPSEIVSRACREFLAQRRHRSGDRAPEEASVALTDREWVEDVPLRQSGDVGSPPAHSESKADECEFHAAPAAGAVLAAVSPMPTDQPAPSSGGTADGPRFPKFNAAMERVARSRGTSSGAAKDVPSGNHDKNDQLTDRWHSKILLSSFLLYVLPASLILLFTVYDLSHLLSYIGRENIARLLVDHDGKQEFGSVGDFATDEGIPSIVQPAPYEHRTSIGKFNDNPFDDVSKTRSLFAMDRSPYRTVIVSTSPLKDLMHDQATVLSHGVVEVHTDADQSIRNDDLFYLQLGSYRDNRTAKKAWSMLSKKLSQLLDHVEPYFEMTEGGGVVYHRLQIGPFATREYAAEFCAEIKKEGFECFVTRRKAMVESPGEQDEQGIDPDRTVESEKVSEPPLRLSGSSA